MRNWLVGLVLLLAVAVGTAQVSITNPAGGGGSADPPTDGSAFTTDITITKADPFVNLVPATPTDTRWFFGTCEDAGSDDDDPLTIHYGSTPCTNSFFRIVNTATQAGILLRPNSGTPTFIVALRHAADGNFEIDLTGGANDRLFFDNNSSTHASCFTWSSGFTERWKIQCSGAFPFYPEANASYDIGTRTKALRQLVSESVTLVPTNAAPTCDSTQRGRIYYTNGGAGVADKVEVCSKDAADAYAWRAFTVAGL